MDQDENARSLDLPATRQGQGWILIRVFLPFAMGYLLSYLLRVINAVIAPDLIGEFGLNADDLGLLTGAYFFTFALVQVPLGLLLDRFGPRRTEAFLLLFAAAGALVFAEADGLTVLLLGRALIGMGVAACLMAAFTAYVIWFPPQLLPLINGCQLAAGGLGAVIGTVPIQAALTLTDWRGIFTVVAGVILLVALLLFVSVPERRTGASPVPLAALLSGIGQVFTSPTFWRAAPLTVMSQASFLSIQGLWAGPWLSDVAGLPPADAGRVLLAISLAMMGGFLGMGWIAGHLGRLGIAPIRTAVAGMTLFILVQTVIVTAGVPVAQIAWIGFGFFGTTGSITYAALSQRFPAPMAGRVNTSLNVLVFVVAFLGQWMIGVIIALWPRSPSGHYDPKGYDAAFTIMLALQVAGLLWFALYRRDGVPQA